MVVDAFPFFNELDLLEIRLAELAPVVDRFLLVEAAETFSGKPKPLYFRDNRERFAEYPITSAVIEAFPAEMHSSWQRECYQRQVIRTALQDMGLAASDMVLLSDIDEIPRGEALGRCVRSMPGEVRGTVYIFDQPLSYYYVNCRARDPWHGTRMARWEDVPDMQVFRTAPGALVRNGGWHFSYMGGPERVREKIGAYAHTELDRPEYTAETHVRECLAQGADLFGRDTGLEFVSFDESFPAYLRENRDRFSYLIREKTGDELVAELFHRAAGTPSDIFEHLPYLYRLASTVNHVTEMGTRTGQSTLAFIRAKPGKLVSYDIVRHPAVDGVERAALLGGVDYEFHEQDVLEAKVAETDLLFLDTWHVEEQMRQELALHADKARRYIALHDTQSFADTGETAGMGGIWPPIADFLRANPHWHILQHFPNNNGLTVLARAYTSSDLDGGDISGTEPGDGERTASR